VSWYDYAAIVLALLLALNAESDARAATRAGVAMYLSARHQDWIRSFDMRTIFGLASYRALRDLHADGVIERKTTPGDEKRAKIDNVWYRWKGPPS
jgi:hypothetical protein